MPSLVSRIYDTYSAQKLMVLINYSIGEVFSSSLFPFLFWSPRILLLSARRSISVRVWNPSN